MRLFALAGAGLLASLGNWPDAQAACSCQEEQSSPEQLVLSAMQDADYVALVRIKFTDAFSLTYEQDVAVWNPESQQSDNQRKEVTDHLLVAEFDAQRVFKGPETPMFVETPAAEDGCGISFKPGETYLIYAQQLETLEQVSTSRCMRTALEAESAKDIEILEEIARRKSAHRPPVGSPEFVRALSLIHAYAGCGDYRWQDPKFQEGLSEAMAIADALAKSDPRSGSSQALRAELMSLWELQDGGEPALTLQAIFTLTEEALRINPAFAQAYVARARAYAKTYDTMQAVKEIQNALGIDPLLHSALLAQAEIYRLNGNSAKAEQWARTFVETTQEPAQKANGYEWLGRMRRDIAYHPQAFNREVNLLLAKAAFETSVGLDPKDPWRLLNLASFLNEYLADFVGAEKYARMALELEDLPAARDQLAAARYQALQAGTDAMDVQSLQAAIADIAAATGRSLEELDRSGEFREVVRVRLLRLKRSANRR